MADMRELIDTVSTAFTERARRFASTATVAKVLVIVGSALATALHFAGHDHWTAVDYSGMFASLLVVVCGGLLLSVDRDPSTELEVARKAIEEARIRESELAALYDEFPEQETARNRAVELYRATVAMSEVIEYALELDKPLAHTIEKLLETGKRSLKISCGFNIDQHYTICIYEARPAPATSRQKLNLHCVAHDRSVMCEVANARVWPSGVGVGGYAHSTGDEVIVPDLTAASLGSVTSYQPKPDDGTVYRSIAAIPIRVGSNPEPWGVVVGTSNVPEHFNTEPGVQTAEGLRALATMVSLAVQAHTVRQILPVKQKEEETK